ncbi:hypothetical protein [Profundibacter sp.]|uniref:hypothetical protein n=1 Tax=Profundibacter sp. TaxID=3101071 RepID=UPI003D10706A
MKSLQPDFNADFSMDMVTVFISGTFEGASSSTAVIVISPVRALRLAAGGT